MTKNHLIIFLLVVAASFVASSATRITSNSNATPTVYELLVKYHFPLGILPEGIQNYTLQPDGSFYVTLPVPGECEIDVAGFKIRYESKIQGNIKSMLISGLQGVSATLGTDRVDINSVKQDDNQLILDAGVISTTFPIHDFDASPRCNAGPGFPK